MKPSNVKSLMHSAADKIETEEHACILAGNSENMSMCYLVGNVDEVIGMLAAALMLSVGSITDPCERLKVKQEISTAIMTEDLSNVVKRLEELKNE